jgi:hypothetical protein
MTWTELVEQLRRTGNVAIEEQQWCGLKLPLDGRQQKVAVKLAANEPSLIVSAQVCRCRYLEPAEALRYSGCSEHWSLVVEHDFYVLRRTVALRGLEWADLSYFIDWAGSEATRLYRQKTRAPLSSEQLLSRFAHWCEA